MFFNEWKSKKFKIHLFKTKSSKSSKSWILAWLQMGLIQANFGSNMSWVDFGFVSNGFSYKQWPLHSCYRVFRWPRQISFHPKRGHMIWKQQKSKNLGFDAKSSNWPLEIARGQCQIANCKCQGPRANSQVQIANLTGAIAKCQGQSANCKGSGARNFTQEGPTSIKNIPTSEKPKLR